MIDRLTAALAAGAITTGSYAAITVAAFLALRHLEDRRARRMEANPRARHAAIIRAARRSSAQ